MPRMAGCPGKSGAGHQVPQTGVHQTVGDGRIARDGDRCFTQAEAVQHVELTGLEWPRVAGTVQGQGDDILGFSLGI